MSRCRVFGLALLAGLAAPPLAAQGSLRAGLNGLFTFGDCAGPCVTSLGVPQLLQGSASWAPARLFDLLSSSVAVGVSNLPISPATSGVSFNIVGGAPVPTSSSGGPIFGERVQTLSRGRFLVGAHISGVRFTSVRGTPLSNLAFTFTHQNVCRATGTPPQGGTCPAPFAVDSLFGSPGIENDVVNVNMSIDLKLQVAALSLAYGLTDRIDVGVILPFVRSDLSGGSIARVDPFVNATPQLFGTAANPVYSAGAGVSGTASGIGDVSARAKMNLGGSDRGIGVVAEASLPTGDEDQFLGSGEFALRIVGIASAKYGNFTPHVNAGYLFRKGAALNDAVLTTVGFDQLMSGWATLAVDMMGQWEVGNSGFRLPGPVTFAVPVKRKVAVTNIPNRSDDILDASLGFRFLTHRGITIITNAAVPLNSGGMRGQLVWTGGVEYTF